VRVAPRKGYERYRRDEVNLYLNKAKSIVESNPAPWIPQNLGQPPYPPKAMVTLLLKTWLGIDYRSISAYLHAFPEQRIRIGLKKTPSTENTISCATRRLYKKRRCSICACVAVTARI
jgi:hypothetical protein